MNAPSSDAARRTPLYAAHVESGARMVGFSGWEMPVNYGSQLEEHHAVRRAAGMFDVSHMLALDLSGADTTAFLRILLANDVARAHAGKALYSCMLNPAGGVLDDLIVYRLSENDYRIVVNAGTAEKDVAWMRQQIATRGANLSLESRRDLAMIAVQGPQALALALQAIVGTAPPHKTQAQGHAQTHGLDKVEDLPAPFSARSYGELFVARTGYTGEDGLEITLPAARAPALWAALASAGIQPCGLGARDTLRLEAGLMLYGQDMDETVCPLDAGLAWTIDQTDPERDFIGKSALFNHGTPKRMLGLILEGPGVLRAHMAVRTAAGSGVTTSGSFSPTLQRAIAFARLPAESAPGESVEVEIRGKWHPARSVKLPFVRKGKILV